MLTTEQIMAANKANLDTLFNLTNKAFAGVEKMVELNVTAAKAALAESAQHAKASLSVLRTRIQSPRSVNSMS